MRRFSTKPWKDIKRRYANTKVLIKKSEQLTKALCFKTIDNVIFSKEHRDLVIRFKSGETLTIKDYVCESCEADFDYDRKKMEEFYISHLQGLTVMMVRIGLHDQSGPKVFYLDIFGLNSVEEICGFHGPLIVRPQHKVKKKFYTTNRKIKFTFF